MPTCHPHRIVQVLNSLTTFYTMSCPTTINTYIYNQPTFQAIVNPRDLKGIEVNKKSTYAIRNLNTFKHVSRFFMHKKFSIYTSTLAFQLVSKIFLSSRSSLETLERNTREEEQEAKEDRERNTRENLKFESLALRRVLVCVFVSMGNCLKSPSKRDNSMSLQANSGNVSVHCSCLFYLMQVHDD
jgi:hypothetical protein